MLPDALLALWLKLLTDGVLDGDRTKVLTAAFGLAASTTATWYVRVVNDRVQRRFRDRIAIAMEAHIARLQASVPTIEHQERPDYLDRLAVLRDQSFMLDHLFSSLLSNIGLIVRLAVTAALLASSNPPSRCCCSPVSRRSPSRSGVPASSGPCRSRWRPTTGWPVTCSRSGPRRHRPRRSASSASRTSCGLAGGRRAIGGSLPSPPPAGTRRSGRPRRGRCSGWPTWPASPGSPRASTAASATSCSSSSPGSGCPSTSLSRWVSSGSSAACGSTRHSD